MWELIEFINGVAVILGTFGSFEQCEMAADYRTYLNDGTALVICAVTI